MEKAIFSSSKFLQWWKDREFQFSWQMQQILGCLQPAVAAYFSV